MGLMKCPECGCDIESSLNQCPLCDCKIHKDGNTQHYTAKNNNTNDLLSGKDFVYFCFVLAAIFVVFGVARINSPNIVRIKNITKNVCVVMMIINMPKCKWIII